MLTSPRATWRDLSVPVRLSRRALLKFGAVAAALLALPPQTAPLLAAGLSRRPRFAVVWLSFQGCDGCTESLLRSAAPGIEDLLFDLMSLAYQPLLQAAAGEAAEMAREAALKDFHGELLLVVDGAVPTALAGACSTSAGESGLDLLGRCLAAAAAVLALGSCAAFGGLPAARPNPTGAMSVGALMDAGRLPRRPLVNLPGCPPIPEVIGAVLAHRATFGCLPDLDAAGRPVGFYSETVHERCARRRHFDAGRFAKTFDDDGAKAGWCLLELGCRGMTTRNACATVRWQGIGSPILAGHPCLGCSEPGFWDNDGFYDAVEPPEVDAVSL